MMPKMRRIPIFTIILLVVTLALLTNLPAVAQEGVSPVLISDQIDPQIDLILPKIQQFQADYVKTDKDGQYYQMLWSHNLLPADGDTRIADNLTAKPTDRPDSGLLLWQFIKASDLTSNFRLRIDNYDGPKGKGYVIVCQVEINKRVYQRSINVGPETQFNEFWHLVGPDEL